jgi:hypothetical protein
VTARELERRLDLRARLQAIIDELDHLDAEVDVPRRFAEGALEELDAALLEEVEQAA